MDPTTIANDRSSEVELIITMRVDNARLDGEERMALHRLAYKAAARLLAQSQLIGGTRVKFTRRSSRQGGMAAVVDIEKAATL